MSHTMHTNIKAYDKNSKNEPCINNVITIMTLNLFWFWNSYL